MSNRLKQFIMQYRFKKMPLDEKFLKKHLNEKEREIFDQLNRTEQNHSTLVAKTIANQKPIAHHSDFIKVGLLHDVGKSLRHLTVMEKVFCVITQKILGNNMKKIASWDNVASHLFHGERGAEILRRHQIFNHNPIFYDVVKTHHWNQEKIKNQIKSKNILIYHTILKKIDDRY